MNKEICIRRCVTLIEMMIVMFLIAMIIGVVAYNYQGTLEESKAFKTQTTIEKVQTILSIEISKNPSLAENLRDRWQEVVSKSPLTRGQANELLVDGWGHPLTVTYENGNVQVTSTQFDEYRNANPGSAFRGNTGG